MFKWNEKKKINLMRFLFFKCTWQFPWNRIIKITDMLEIEYVIFTSFTLFNDDGIAPGCNEALRKSYKLDISFHNNVRKFFFKVIHLLLISIYFFFSHKHNDYQLINNRLFTSFCLQLFAIYHIFTHNIQFSKIIGQKPKGVHKHKVYVSWL